MLSLPEAPCTASPQECNISARRSGSVGADRQHQSTQGKILNADRTATGSTDSDKVLID